MSEINLKSHEKVRMTLTLPPELVKHSQHFVDAGVAPSCNALIIDALERYLSYLERQEIDRQFISTAEYKDYQALILDIAETFAESDWEALSIEE